MDKLPVRINPDRLSTSVVEIRYKSNLEHQFCLGLFNYALRQRFKLAPNEEQKSALPGVSNSENSQAFIRITPDPVYFDDNIRLTIKEGSFVFNLFTNYPGWSAYFDSLQSALDLLAQTDIEFDFKRVGIRFISQYEELDLKDVTRFTFGFGFPDVKSENFTFRNEFDYENCRIVITIGNQIGSYSKPVEGGSKRVSVSEIDIDCIQEPLGIKGIVPELLEVIDRGHHIQKKVFFTLLKPDFLEKLKPEYDDE